MLLVVTVLAFTINLTVFLLEWKEGRTKVYLISDIWFFLFTVLEIQVATNKNTPLTVRS